MNHHLRVCLSSMSQAYQACIYFIIKDKITKEQEEQTYNKHLYQNQFLIRNPEAGMPTPVT